MIRVAAIDCGTNSVRLLVADVGSGAVRDVHRETRVVRLGEGVDRDRRLRPEALQRTRTALADYAATIARLGAARVRLVATSATRDAANRDEFTALVRAGLGVEPDVLSGAQEAALALAGARSGLADPHRPLLVVDVGGGSTELVRDDGGVVTAHSMDVGAVRLTERHLRQAPPSDAAVAAAREDVRAALRLAARDVRLSADVEVVGVAATVLTAVALAEQLERYESGTVHGRSITVDQLADVTRWLLSAGHDRIAASPVVSAGREDVIAAGALVLQEVLAALGAHRITASERDILDGIALDLAR